MPHQPGTRRYLNGTDADKLYDVAEDLQQPVTLSMGACGEVGAPFLDG